MPRRASFSLIPFALLFLPLLTGCASLRAMAPAGSAHSAILMIGDGMGLVEVQTAAAWSGKPLAIESLPVLGLARTRSSNSFVTDSAAAVTALACGVRTTNGTIGMTDPATDPSVQSRKLQNLSQVALAAGKSVGVVSTAHVTHATPAGFYAHVPERGDEVEIADQVALSGLTLLLGGGRQFFYPTTWRDPETSQPGARKDGRNVARELTGQGWTLVNSRAEFEQLDPARAGLRVLGLFESDHMRYDLERPKDPLGEPSLAELTAFAIKVLSRNPRGYFLMVEGGRIDHAGHANDIANNIGDLLAFDDAIATARDMAGPGTLLVVTADHETGGLTLPGEVKAGELPTTGQGIQWSTKGHTAAHVGVFANGPGAAPFDGWQDNWQIPLNIAAALGLEFTDPINHACMQPAAH